MQFISSFLSTKNYTLMSGGAVGADSAFEIGTDNKIIFLHDKCIINLQNALPSQYYYLQSKWDSAYNLAKKYYHSDLTLRSDYVKRLMTRNVFQILGADLNSISDFVICWTKDGKASGGTGQALRIAEAYNVPIYNMKNDKDMINLKKFLISLK